MGAELAGGAGQVLVDELNPATSPAGVDVHASRTRTARPPTGAAAYAICANAVAAGGRESVSDSESAKSAVALPRRQAADRRRRRHHRRLRAGGARRALAPASDPTFAERSAVEDGPAPRPTGPCAPTRSAPRRSGRARAGRPLDSLGSKRVKATTVTCPGRQAGGGRAGRRSGRQRARSVLEDVEPDPALTQREVSAIEDGDGTTANWQLDRRRDLRQPPPGLELVTASSASDSDEISERDRDLPGRQEPARHRREDRRRARAGGDRRPPTQRRADRDTVTGYEDRDREHRRLERDRLRDLRQPLGADQVKDLVALLRHVLCGAQRLTRSPHRTPRELPDLVGGLLETSVVIEGVSA